MQACSLFIVGICLLGSLFWDFSWESTIGIDLVWSPPHFATYAAVAMAGIVSLVCISGTSSFQAHDSGVQLLGLEAPLGAWVSLWGALAFLSATLLDRWWQSNYGLVAGLWHPPQIAKTVAFFAIAIGAWLLCLTAQNRGDFAATRVPAVSFCAAAGVILSLITFVSLTAIYPNRQHSALFYRLASIAYPLVLVATAISGKLRFSATIGSLFYMVFVSLAVWLLPLFPAKPQVAPIYNPLDHLMPPPFPLLLIVPAFVIDAIHLVGRARWRHVPLWLQAFALGVGFFFAFIATQWVFAEFLLSDLADNWFFAGAGKHWPFFLKIDAAARTTFWDLAQDRLTIRGIFTDVLLAVASATAGVFVGKWMKTARR